MGGIVDYLIWIIVGIFGAACIVVLAVMLLMTYEKRHREASDARLEKVLRENKEVVSGLENRIQTLETDLASEQGENESRKRLLASIAESAKGHGGKVSIYAFDSVSGANVYSEASDDGLASLITGNGEIPLREALEDIRQGEERVSLGEKRFSVTYSSEENTEVYIITDITDTVNLADVTKDKEALEERIDGCDILTVSMDFGAFVKRHTEAYEAEPADDNWLLFMQTEPTVIPDEIMSGFNESYTRMCADLLTERFGTKYVTRYAGSSFCCIFKAEDEESALKTAEETANEVEAKRKELWPVDERLVNRSVWELSHYDGSDLEQYVFCLGVRARVDIQRENSGVRLFATEDVIRIMGYKTAIETAIAKKQVRFQYQPIAYSTNAKVFGYEMLPYFPTLPFPSLEEMLRRARLFGLTNGLEEIICSEAINLFAKAVNNLKLLSSTRILLKSLSGACMVSRAEEEFHEKHYDLLPNFITELDEELPESQLIASIKRSNIENWGAWAAVRMSDDMEDAGMKVGVYHPEFVRIYASIMADKERASAVKDLIERLHEDGYLVMADGITKPAEVEAAIHAGADFLQGEYVSKATDEPGEISEKCMRKIGQVRFGKRG